MQVLFIPPHLVMTKRKPSTTSMALLRLFQYENGFLSETPGQRLSDIDLCAYSLLSKPLAF